MKRLAIAVLLTAATWASPAAATVIRVIGAGTLTSHTGPGPGPNGLMNPVTEAINSPINFEIQYDTDGRSLPQYFDAPIVSAVSSPALPGYSGFVTATFTTTSSSSQYGMDVLGAGGVGTGYELRYNALTTGTVSPTQGAVSVLPGSTIYFAYRLNQFAGVLTSLSTASAVPEAATWAMMLVGLGAIGTALRVTRRRATVRFATSAA